MLKLAALLVAVTPAIALADKDFTEGSGASYDCSEDPIVNINHDSGSYTLTGTCSEIHLNGGNLHVTIAETKQLAINGDGNVVKIHTVGEILVNGGNNNVRWKHARSGRRPAVAANGERNSVARSK